MSDRFKLTPEVVDRLEREWEREEGSTWRDPRIEIPHLCRELRATRSALRQLLDECLNNEHTIQHYATGVEMARYYRVSPEAFIEARRVLVSDVSTPAEEDA